jgi:hypothetical protein
MVENGGGVGGGVGGGIRELGEAAAGEVHGQNVRE